MELNNNLVYSGRVKDQAIKEKEIFFASVSHELRNPLNALIGSIELIPDKQGKINKEILETAKICGDTLLHLIGNVLDVSKIEANKLTLSNSPSILPETLKKITRMGRAMARNKGIFLKLISDKKIPECLEFDNPRLLQVLTNLISNAVKFTDKGGIFLKADWYPVPSNYKELGINDSQMQSLLEKSERKRFIESVDGKVKNK